MILDTDKLETELRVLKKEHKEYPEEGMYMLFFDDNGNWYTPGYQKLCDRILAIGAIIYNAKNL